MAINNDINLLLSWDLRNFVQRNSSLQELDRFVCRRSLSLEQEKMNEGFEFRFQVFYEKCHCFPSKLTFYEPCFAEIFFAILSGDIAAGRCKTRLQLPRPENFPHGLTE